MPLSSREKDIEISGSSNQISLAGLIDEKPQLCIPIPFRGLILLEFLPHK